mgnify:FL=1
MINKRLDGGEFYMMKDKKELFRIKDHIIESILVVALIICVIFMMLQIKNLQGTARVVNYAGLVRGGTQRLIKLEITGNKDDELIKKLDYILDGLKNDNSNYDLVVLNDKKYQENLTIQMEYWEELKSEIIKVRSLGYKNTDIIKMSEKYFGLADLTVSATEEYSQQIADNIKIIEYMSIADIMLLIILIAKQYFYAIKIEKSNKILQSKAYIDVHTGLPNKSACEEHLQDTKFVSEPTACIMFDLNNLKQVNDNLGHSASDLLIFNFSRVLRKVVPSKDFVGRFGGDEFIVILRDTTDEGVNQILSNLNDEIGLFNEHSKNITLSYSCGYAISTAYRECTLRTLLDKADSFMYDDKKDKKKQI